LYAHNKLGVLVILQAMDAAGKDGVIKHIMSGLNPQGVEVTLQVPSAEELDHDYLWRSHEHLPERGNIAIFNRSYYEDVLVVKVHNLVKSQNLPDRVVERDIWKERYRQLRDFEQYMHENGIVVVKISCTCQKKNRPSACSSGLTTRTRTGNSLPEISTNANNWQQYQEAYEEMIRETATEHAP